MSPFVRGISTGTCRSSLSCDLADLLDGLVAGAFHDLPLADKALAVRPEPGALCAHGLVELGLQFLNLRQELLVARTEFVQFVHAINDTTSTPDIKNQPFGRCDTCSAPTSTSAIIERMDSVEHPAPQSPCLPLGGSR